jgi:hypothetical protein
VVEPGFEAKHLRTILRTYAQEKNRRGPLGKKNALGISAWRRDRTSVKGL